MALLVTVTAAAAAAVAAPAAPFFALWDPETIAGVRAGVARGDECLAAPAAALDAWAEGAVRTNASYGPWTVMRKKFTPASGDKHDYMSLDKYYWPCNAPPPKPPAATSAVSAEQSPAPVRPLRALLAPRRSMLTTTDNTNPNPDPLCEHGIEHHSSDQPSICCLTSCGACGGSGCADWPGGKAGCCSDGVIAGNRSCDAFPAPCIMDENPCDNKTGLPWYQHDGQVNPLYADFDHDALLNMTQAVMGLVPAAYLSRLPAGDAAGAASLAATAAGLLRTWFTDPATAMNPSMNFGHFIPGVCNGSHGALIDTHWTPELLDAAAMLGYVPGSTWEKSDALALRQWFAAYLRWMNTSSIAAGELVEINNHGLWFDVQRMAVAAHVGWGDFGSPAVERADPKFAWARDMAVAVAGSFGARRINVQIMPNGSLPAEQARTKAFSYCEFATDALFHAGALADAIAREGRGAAATAKATVAGDPLWDFNSSAIQRALDWQLPYAVQNKSWPWPQIVPFFPPLCSENMVDQCASTYFWPVRRAALVPEYARAAPVNYETVLAGIPGLDVAGTPLNMFLPSAACVPVAAGEQ